MFQNAKMFQKDKHERRIQLERHEAGRDWSNFNFIKRMLRSDNSTWQHCNIGRQIQTAAATSSICTPLPALEDFAGADQLAANGRSAAPLVLISLVERFFEKREMNSRKDLVLVGFLVFGCSSWWRFQTKQDGAHVHRRSTSSFTAGNSHPPLSSWTSWT